MARKSKAEVKVHDAHVAKAEPELTHEEQEAVDSLQGSFDANAARVQAAYDFMEAGRPTPTQEECDLAKLGLLDHDQKEPDGSAEEPGFAH